MIRTWASVICSVRSGDFHPCCTPFWRKRTRHSSIIIIIDHCIYVSNIVLDHRTGLSISTHPFLVPRHLCSSFFLDDQIIRLAYTIGDYFFLVYSTPGSSPHFHACIRCAVFKPIMLTCSIRFHFFQLITAKEPPPETTLQVWYSFDRRKVYAAYISGWPHMRTESGPQWNQILDNTTSHGQS